jgi:hypothetical protein
MEETPSAKTYLGWALSILGGLALLAALLLGLWHVFEWLRDGIWPHLSGAEMMASLGIPPPAIPWAWAQSAIDWIFSWSAAFLLTCSAIILVILGTNLSDDYDRKSAAARKARSRFEPASDVERAARWARESAGAEANLDLEELELGDEDDEIDDGDEGDDDEKALPPPPPPRTLRERATDGFLGCGCIVLLFVVGLGLFICWDYFDRIHYNRVSAHVRSVARNCVLEWEAPRDPALWEKSGRPRSEEMPCDQAAQQAPTAHAHVIETLSVTYTYTSPVDGRAYDGALHRDAVDFPPDVRVGGEMPVYALKANPGRSRGIYQWPVD